MGRLFVLKAAYELFVDLDTAKRPLRIEIFCDADTESVFRARVWVQNTYNLYQTFANIREEGGLEQRLLSCDELNREITSVIAEEPSLIEGKEYPSEAVFLAYVLSRVERFREEWCRGRGSVDGVP